MEKNPKNNWQLSKKENQWKSIYLLGGLAALIAFGGILSDIIIGSISSGDFTALPKTAIERFSEFQENWLLGLYHLDLLNVIISIIMIPVYFAFFAVHRHTNPAYAALAIILALISTTIFISTNTSLPMLELSSKYYSTTIESHQILLAAAGEAMLARGGHGSFGVFIGFLLSTIASLNISFVMLAGNIFKRVVAYFGIIGSILLFIYILLVTFVPSIQRVAVMIAAPGGLLTLAWLLLVGIKFIKIGISKTLGI